MGKSGTLAPRPRRNNQSSIIDNQFQGLLNPPRRLQTRKAMTSPGRQVSRIDPAAFHAHSPYLSLSASASTALSLRPFRSITPEARRASLPNGSLPLPVRQRLDEPPEQRRHTRAPLSRNPLGLRNHFRVQIQSQLRHNRTNT